jgi:hypothetical protein
MTFARLLLEIRRRAQSTPQDVPRRSAIELAAREVLEVPDDEAFDPSVLEALTPEAVMRIDIELESGAFHEPMRFIRATLAKRST